MNPEVEFNVPKKEAKFGRSNWECGANRQYWNMPDNLVDFFSSSEIGMEDLKQITASADLSEINLFLKMVWKQN